MKGVAAPRAMNPPFIATCIRRDIVESTNDLAQELVSTRKVDCPLLVTAASQTRGRGRGRHSWWSDPGSLTFTVAIDPAAHGLLPEQEPRVALAAAVAVIEAIAAWLAPDRAGIRWPNDIETGGRKLGGILPERVETEWGRRLVLGIGLNVHTRLENAPALVRAMAASLVDIAAAPIHPDDRDRILHLIIGRLDSALRLLACDDPHLAQEWARLDTLRDQPVRLDLGTGIKSGVARGIDRSGALLVETDGVIVPHFGGQVLRDSLTSL